MLNGLVKDFGLSMEVAVYALLATKAENYADALAFVFEEDEGTGLMAHEFVRSLTDRWADEENPAGQGSANRCYICDRPKNVHMYGDLHSKEEVKSEESDEMWNP
mmetsp:Transcript_45670/g.60532  ORF Transcript_45670/g.60532 Transcript_45670/m.60532 type:complete len:105 (-) Transcript_45670:1349-1663(-)